MTGGVCSSMAIRGLGIASRAGGDVSEPGCERADIGTAVLKSPGRDAPCVGALVMCGMVDVEGVEGSGGFGAAVGEVAHEGVDGAAEVVWRIKSVDLVVEGCEGELPGCPRF